MPTMDAPYRGVLQLDDGRCLHVDLARTFVDDGPDWNGRRVAIRGQAVPAEGRGALSNDRCAGGLLLYAERLSLKAA